MDDDGWNGHLRGASCERWGQEGQWAPKSLDKNSKVLIKIKECSTNFVSSQTVSQNPLPMQGSGWTLLPLGEFTGLRWRAFLQLWSLTVQRSAVQHVFSSCTSPHPGLNPPPPPGTGLPTGGRRILLIIASEVDQRQQLPYIGNNRPIKMAEKGLICHLFKFYIDKGRFPQKNCGKVSFF